MFKKKLGSKKTDQWAPSTEKVEAIKEEIINSYRTSQKYNLDTPEKLFSPPLPENEFIEDCAKIGAFLSDKKAVLKQLKNLNLLLQKKMDQYAKEGNEKEIPVSVLTKLLEEEAEKFDFYPYLSKAIKKVSPGVFRDILAQGCLIKDVALGMDSHGEFPHIIQWLLIAWQQRDSNFLKRPVIEIYKLLGSELSVFSRQRVPNSYPPIHQEYALWDLLVEKPHDLNEINLRSPETLTLYILNKKNKLNSLQFFIKKRRSKRIAQNAEGKWMAKYNNETQLFLRKEGRPPYEPSKSVAKSPEVLIPTNKNRNKT